MISLWGVIKGLLIKGESDRSKQLAIEVDSSATTNTRTTLRSSQTANRTIDLPDATDTLVGRDTTDTLTNKTLDNSNAITLKDNLFTLQDDADNTKQVQFDLSGLTAATTRTVSFPDDDTTLVGTDTTQTLENKTMDFSSGGTNTLTADAVDIVYDNTTSGLAALDLQDAIDEIDSSIDSIAADKLDGPGTHGDNVVLRTDGTNTNVMQTSGIIIDDLNNITGIVDLTTTGDVVVGGDLQVNGTLTSVNSTTLEVTDANVIVNNGGNQASANSQGAGFTVEMSDATDAGVAYDSTLATKFKVGEIGSQVEIVGTSSTQTLTNKTINAANNTVSGLLHGTHVDDPSSGVHGVTGSVVGTTDTQVLTNKDIDGGTASNTSRITIPKAAKTTLDGLTRKEGTIVYASDLDKFFGDDGTELFEIGSGGEGGKNYFEGGNFEVNADLASSYDDGGSYVDGTGGTPSFITFASNSTTPLAGDSDLAITKAIGSATGEGVSFLSTTIDRADLGKDLFLEFEYDFTDADYVSGDMQIKAYDVTNAAILPVISVSNLSDDAGLLKTKTKAYARILCSSTTAQVRVSLHMQTDNASGVNWTGYVDDIKLSPTKIFEVVSTGPVGEIIAFGDDTAPDDFLYCDGSAVSRTTYADLFAVIGTNFGSGDGSTTFNVPDLRGRFLRGQADGQSTDPDKASRTAMNSGGNTGDNVGSVQDDATALPNTNFTTGTESAGHTHGTTLDIGGNLINGNIGARVSTGIVFGQNSAMILSSGGVSANHTHTVTGGGDNETRPVNAYVRYYIRFRGQSNLLSANDVASKTIVAEAARNALQSLPDAGTFTLIDLDTVVEDPFNAVNISTDRITFPYSGKVTINGSLTFAFNANGDRGVAISINGSEIRKSLVRAAAANATSVQVQTTKDVNAGDYVQLLGFQQGSGGTLNASGNLLIKYEPDFTTFGVFGETEYKEVILGSNTNLNNGSDVDITGASIPLGVGEWDIEFYVHCFWDWVSGASVGAGASIGVYTAANVFVPGSTGWAYNILNNNDDQVGQVIASKTKVVVTTPTTYKLRGKQNAPTTNVQVSVDATTSLGQSKMIARRIK